MRSELDDGNEDASDGDQGRHRPPEIGIHALIGLIDAVVNLLDLLSQREIGLVNAVMHHLDLFTQRVVGLIDAMVSRLDLFTQRVVGLVDALVNGSYLIAQVLDLFT